ncbi:MAG: hypothetical protein R3C39_10875 [Dehalococcoidia bacterium]
MTGLDEVERTEDAYERTILFYLREGRRALSSHPLADPVSSTEVRAAYCRLATLAVVSALEALMETWQASSPRVSDLLKVYFDRGKSHASRVEALFRAFQEFGAAPERDAIEDLLALKFLRHRVVHMVASDPERARREAEHIDARGFPSDPHTPDAFSESHWRAIFATYWKLRHYLYTVGFHDTARTDLAQRVAAAMDSTPPPIPGDDAPLLIKPSDIPRVWAFNVEFVSARIRARIHEYFARPSEYSAVLARRVEDGTSPAELALFRVTLCQQAIAAGEESLAAELEYAALALDCWREYWASEFERQGLDVPSIAAALQRLRALHGDDASPSPEDESVLTLGGRLYEEHRRALNSGVEFLSVLGPAVDPGRDAEYAQEAIRALDASEVAHRWYALAQGSSPQPTVLDRISVWRDAVRGKLAPEP